MPDWGVVRPAGRNDETALRPVPRRVFQSGLCGNRYMNLKYSGLLLAGLLAGSAAAQDAETFLTADTAGPDFAVQGEYEGEVSMKDGAVNVGLQVIALGDHRFDAVAYPGGLPGAGWNKEDKHRASGETANGETTFESADTHVKAVVKDGVARIMNADGKLLGALKKVERRSPTLGAKPAEGAQVLFDGSSADAFQNGHITMNDLLAADCETKEKFGDHSLHIEFRTPFKPKGRGQGRGNSGVYIQGRYECQVLDSFGLEGENNECGGIYSIAKPAVNACFPPLSWQTYDIDFTAARYEGDRKVSNARVTIRYNGIVIHENLELPHGTPGKHPEAAGPQSLYLQGHGNPVVYRNIWIVKK
ncbi:MAG: DUF1080 domain-containing protein [Planctomycetaceae bacterium]|nr:DUF1080 domain-containing protein [Planctomycetaceae bacterium]